MDGAIIFYKQDTNNELFKIHQLFKNGRVAERAKARRWKRERVEGRMRERGVRDTAKE